MPEGLERFIVDNLDSTWQIDVLLRLRESPEQQLTAAEIAKLVYLDKQAAELALSKLHESGLVSRSGDKYQFAPASAELQHMVDNLSDTYNRSRFSVLQLLYTGRKAP